MSVVGVVHPGAMGSSLGAALAGNGHDPIWAGEGRSEATRARAAADGLREVAHVDDLATADVIFSVCPPAAATAVATEVMAGGFDGIYVEGNAVAPATARAIGATVEAAGAAFVDGGIVGPPARHRGLTILYLAGPPAAVETVVDLFADSPLLTHAVGDSAGAASATKMAFAAWTKGTSALLLAIRALAERERVVDALEHAWSVLTPELATRLAQTATATGPKAWRFEGEMREIASTFEAAGLPGGFHAAAAEIYHRLSDLRDVEEPTVADVVDRLGPHATDV